MHRRNAWRSKSGKAYGSLAIGGGTNAAKNKISAGKVTNNLGAIDATDAKNIVKNVDVTDAKNVIKNADITDAKNVIKGIDATDVKNAVKDVDTIDVTDGKYSLLGEMKDADGKEYQRFLKDGPQEGLTQTEIIGIYKADKQTALNMKSKSVVSGKSIEGGSNTKRLNELRNSLPEKYQIVDSYGNKIGNIAYSTSDIAGYQIEEMRSFSKYGNIGQSGIKNPIDGWVSSVENPAYSESVLKINSDNQIDNINGYLRNNDTEYKIIENYNQILNGDYYVRGKITIVSEREVCPSCDNVIKAFSKDYSNLEIILIDGTGNTYIVKGGIVQ